MLARVSDQYCPDRILRDREEPPLGAHLVTPRIGYRHHGIYVGAGKVVHCGAVSRLLPRGPVEEVSLACFSRGRPISVRAGGPARFGALEVIQRARSRVGEDRYRLLTDNCEHLCEWCLHGRPAGAGQGTRCRGWPPQPNRRGSMLRGPSAGTWQVAPRRRRSSTVIGGAWQLLAANPPSRISATCGCGERRAGGSGGRCTWAFSLACATESRQS